MQINGRIFAFTTSIRMDWSAKDQGSQRGSAHKVLARMGLALLALAEKMMLAGGAFERVTGVLVITCGV